MFLTPSDQKTWYAHIKVDCHSQTWKVTVFSSPDMAVAVASPANQVVNDHFNSTKVNMTHKT